MNNPLVVFLLLNIFNTAIMIEKTILYIKVILSILYGYPNFEIKKILRFLSRFGADDNKWHTQTLDTIALYFLLIPFCSIFNSKTELF